MSETQQPKRGRGRIVGLIATFVAGLLVMAWVLTSTEAGRSLIEPDTNAEAIADAAPLRAIAEPPAPANAAALPAAPGDLAFRIASLEARLASLESRPSTGGSGASPRVEALLLTLTASRRLERGERLGALEGELAARFGAMDPTSVNALASWSAAPVRVFDLQNSFEKVAPALAGGEGWWDQLTTSMGSLIIVRDEKSASSSPAQTVKEARALVQDGKIEPALTLVRRLPKSPEANRWIGDATRLVDAQKAMTVLETRALDLTARVAVPAPPKPLAGPEAVTQPTL